MKFASLGPLISTIALCLVTGIHDLLSEFETQMDFRDSEIAVLVRDSNYVDSTMNDEPFKAAKFAHSLRCHLWGVRDTKQNSTYLSFTNWIVFQRNT